VNTDSLDAGWLRENTSGGPTFTVYQPRLEKWEGERLEAKAAAYGVREGL
jgi:hypothetical protein